MKMKLLFSHLVVAVLMLPVATVHGEIYKYQDESGNWHFTDKPPQSEQPVESINLGSTRISSLPQDLAEVLEKKYRPESAIERATLAVVSVKTGLGSGSGFFVTDNGFIVTNRHVVRPTENPNWKEREEELKKAEQRLKEAEARLAQRKSQLAKMKREIEQYEESITGYSDREKRVANTELKLYQDRYRDRRREYDDVEARIREERQRLSQHSSDFKMKSSGAQFATTFKVVLKDGSNLTARLVRASQNEDLALLKVDDHVTPALDIDNGGVVKQGMTVYAIGSPLGMKDFVTSGIITGVRSDKIVTDSQILPGNSGGPLINDAGEVLGVNTQKLLATGSIGSEGFGLAIPVDVVRKEFGGLIN